MEVLVLNPADYKMMDRDTLETVKSNFDVRKDWREIRRGNAERARVSLGGQGPGSPVRSKGGGGGGPQELLRSSSESALARRFVDAIGGAGTTEAFETRMGGGGQSPKLGRATTLAAMTNSPKLPRSGSLPNSPKKSSMKRANTVSALLPPQTALSQLAHKRRGGEGASVAVPSSQLSAYRETLGASGLFQHSAREPSYLAKPAHWFKK
jgi:hypothetical protein